MQTQQTYSRNRDDGDGEVKNAIFSNKISRDEKYHVQLIMRPVVSFREHYPRQPEV